MRSLQTYLFIGELDGIELWVTNVINAYLEAVTSEKVCNKAGPEFGELEGHLLIIYKVLYGLRLNRKAFWQLLQEYSQKSTFAEPSIYMRNCPLADHFEYIATYVDDLALIMKDPKVVVRSYPVR